MLTHVRENFRVPAPVFEHLAGCFDEVACCVCSVEAAVACAGDDVVDAVTELVEKRRYFVVLEKAGLRCC